MARNGPANPPTRSVGSYELLDLIGSGGMAAVYRAKHQQTGQLCAVKVLHPASLHADDLEDVKRFKREFHTLARLDHPNVVRVYDAGVEERYPWIAMELIEGVDLDGLIERWMRSPPVDRMAQVERILKGLCAAFVYLHGLGLVHRDLKPGNILIDSQGNPKITDFGVVKNPEATWTQLTVAGKLVGTVAFMAPEQITNDQVGPRADLYALGAVLYMMLTFHRPIEADSVAGYLARHLSAVPIPPSEHDPSVPPRIEAVCLKLLRKEPEQRYSSASAVLEALENNGVEVWPLRGREELVTALRDSLRALINGGNGVVLLHGTAGSGRSSLLDHVITEALAAKVTALRVTESQDLQQLPDDGRPLLLAVDDLHQHPELVDDVARAFRAHLAGLYGPILLIGATGDLEETAVSGLVGGLSTGLPAEVHHLAPLERRAVVALLRDRHVAGAAAPVLGRRLHEDHHGTPGPIILQLEALTAAGWLVPTEGSLQAGVPIDDLRAAVLPVPAGVREQLEEHLAELRTSARTVITYLAALNRPCPISLLQRCTGDDDVEGALRTLQRAELVRHTNDGEQDLYAPADPALAVVVDQTLAREERLHIHGRIVRALSARRRHAPSLELAEHLLIAEQPAGAFRHFMTAARRLARAQRHREVLDLCTRAEPLLSAVELGTSPAEAHGTRRALYELRGEACLALARWEDASTALHLALDAARLEGEPASIGRILAALGRAHYRRGSFDEAHPLLNEALDIPQLEATERAAATRALADISLQYGDLDTSDELWRQALEIGEELQSRDAQARAQRGLAHLAGVRFDLPGCARLLDRAEELLHPDGDPWVRSGVLVRRIELDWASGRFLAGLRRAESHLAFVQNHDMPERLPVAHALVAELLAALGQDEQVHRQIRNTLTYAATIGARAWDARLRVARLLCVLGRRDEALDALPAARDLPSSHVDGPSVQRAAIQARCLATTEPSTATDLAQWVSTRPPPLLAVRGAEITIDTTWALADIGDVEGARAVAKQGLRAAQHAEMDGLRLGLLVALFHARPDDRVREAILQIATRIGADLPRELKAGFQATLNPR